MSLLREYNRNHLPRGAPDRNRDGRGDGGQFAPKFGARLLQAKRLGKKLNATTRATLTTDDYVAVKHGDGHIFGKFNGRYKNREIGVKLDDGREVRVKPGEVTHLARPRIRGSAENAARKSVAAKSKPVTPPVVAPPSKPARELQRKPRPEADMPKMVRGKSGEPAISKLTRDTRRRAPTAPAPAPAPAPTPAASRPQPRQVARSPRQITRSPHDDLPQLPLSRRLYEGYGATRSRAAPPHVRDLGAWERASEKIGKPYEEWEPRDFAKATALYKNIIKKYGVGVAAPDKPYVGWFAPNAPWQRRIAAAGVDLQVTGGNERTERIGKALASLPPAVLAKLRAEDVKVEVTDGDAAEGLFRAVMRSGRWTAGERELRRQIRENLPDSYGVFLPEMNVLVISGAREPSTGGVERLVHHEVGHFLTERVVTNRGRRSPEYMKWAELVDAELRGGRVPARIRRHLLSYVHDPKGNDRQNEALLAEFLAETYALRSNSHEYARAFSNEFKLAFERLVES